jgi:hypothetical protein
MSPDERANTARLMRELAKDIDGCLNAVGSPKTNGFVLLVFPFGSPEGRRVNYVSNAMRTDIVASLKEIVARFEGRFAEPGPAKQ